MSSSNSQGPAASSWDDKASTQAKRQYINEQRNRFIAEHIGEVPKDMLRLPSFNPFWPGGGFHVIKADKLGEGIHAYTTFGLTNHDMPTDVAVKPLNEHDSTMESMYRKRSAEETPSYPTRAGYGYELMLLCPGESNWAMGVLKWAANAELLNDADLVAKVNRNKGIVLQDIPAATRMYVNLLIDKAPKPIPSNMDLPHGRADVLVATVITDDELAWSKEHGCQALADKLYEAGVGPISHPDRGSIFNPAPVNVYDVDTKEKADALLKKGYLRKIHLFPEEFGGKDVEANRAYLPREAAFAKFAVDQQVFELAHTGQLDHYTVEPQYKDGSVIPSAIKLIAKGKQGFEKTVEVWSENT